MDFILEEQIVGMKMKVIINKVTKQILEVVELPRKTSG